MACRAERSRSSAFLSGFVMGGVVFGALGFLFAPQVRHSCISLLPPVSLWQLMDQVSQISAALLSEDQRLKLPRFLEEEEKDPEATRQACTFPSDHVLHIVLTPLRGVAWSTELPCTCIFMACT